MDKKAEHNDGKEISQKERLEIDKLELEIKQLSEPFYKKTQFIVTFLGTLISLTLAYFLGFFNIATDRIRNQRDLLLIEQKSIKVANDSLTTEKIRLEGLNLEIQRQTRNNEILRDSLILKNSELSGKSNLLTAKLDSLNVKEILTNKNLVKSQILLDSISTEVRNLRNELDKPYLNFYVKDRREDNRLELSVRNVGNGIAKINSYNIIHDNQTYDVTGDLNELQSALMKASPNSNPTWLRFFVFDPGDILGDKEEQYLVRVNRNYNPKLAEDFTKLYENLNILICFESASGVKGWKMFKAQEYSGQCD